jgi:tetratricopeptide (TPR) repeat protein
MSRDDWFRNTDWNADVEAAFFKKLSRARDKAQYLRIQASTLRLQHPAVALKLLSQYFELGEHFDIAQAFADKASAELALGDVDGAIRSYEDALKREAEYPKLLTNAYLYLPLLIVRRGLKERYSQAVEILERHKGRLSFPVDHFLWNSVNAIVLSKTGKRSEASVAALAALEAAGLQHSGFRYHPNVGLVEAEYDDVLQHARKIAYG